ncbi:MAG: lysophospholipid acyltransferase family protein, partial [Pseudomonadota bacterium]
ELLGIMGVDLKVSARQWPPRDLPDTPLVIIANHPFGIGDGIAILSIAEALNRPFKILINKELMKVPEICRYSLPVDFEETREAMQTNLQTKREAIRYLNEGYTIVIFPAGGVATAKKPFGKAEDLPWKVFPARLIQQAKADVLPVYFQGQNSWFFHIASHISQTLRISLLIREFGKFAGSMQSVYIGDLIPYEEFAPIRDRKALTQYLYDCVFGMDPTVEQKTA